MSAANQVDYDALAKQHGGVDYDSLAAQHGGTELATDPYGTPAEDWHGVKEFGRDLWGAVKGVGSLLDPRIPTSQDDERTGESHAIDRGLAKFAPLLLPGYRAVKGMVMGTQDSIERSRQSMEEGDTAGTVFHTAAAALPVVGQLTEGVYDKANSGDTSGAVGAGLSRALQISTLGSDEPGVVGRTTSAPVRAAGRLTATSAGLSKDAVVGGYRGFTREPGVVARPTNAVIEAATEMGKRLKPTPMLERMTKTPVGEKFAPTDVKADAQSGDHPIDMSAGEISGHPTLQRIQQVGERSLTGGEPVRERIEGAQRAIAERVNDLKEGYAPGDKVPDTETAGLTVQKQAQTAMQKLKTSAQAKFDKWIAKAGDVPVDTSAINEKYGQKMTEMEEALKGMPSNYAAPIRQLLQKAQSMGIADLTAEEEATLASIEQVKQQVPNRYQEVLDAQGITPPAPKTGMVKMSSAQMLRSAYSDIANNFTGNVPSQVQHLAGELYHDIDSAMENSAKSYSQSTGKRGVMRGYRDANAEWSQMQTLYNSPGEPLYRTLKATDGQKVVNQLLEPGTSGGSPKHIRVLRDQGIDLGPLQREVVERIHNKNFGVYGKSKLGGYSDAFLRELFGPVGMEELHMLGRQARAVNYNVNPSGTAGVMSATHDLTDVAKAGGQVAKGNFPWYLENPFIKYGAAKLANNPAFNDWMTNTKGAAVEPGGREFRLGKGPGAMLAEDSKLVMENGPMTQTDKKTERIEPTQTLYRAEGGDGSDEGGLNFTTSKSRAEFYLKPGSKLLKVDMPESWVSDYQTASGNSKEDVFRLSKEDASRAEITPTAKPTGASAKFSRSRGDVGSEKVGGDTKPIHRMRSRAGERDINPDTTPNAPTKPPLDEETLDTANSRANQRLVNAKARPKGFSEREWANMSLGEQNYVLGEIKKGNWPPK